MRRKIAEQRKSSAWPTVLPKWPALLSSLPVATVILTLIGYGYDLAYLESFGLSPQTLDHGPLDFLLRSTYGLLRLIDKLNTLKDWLTTAEGVNQIWQGTEWMRYIGAAVALALLLLAIALKELAGNAPFESSFLMRSIERSHRVLALAIRTAASIRRDWRFLLGSAAVGWACPPVIAYLLGAILWIAGSLVLVALTAAPLAGFAAGKAYAHEGVIEPTHCRQTSGDGRKAKDGALCVRVLKDGKELARGRLIDQKNNRAWLFRKQPWAVSAIPLDGAVIEYTGSESPG